MIYRINLSPWPGMSPEMIGKTLSDLGFNSIAIAVKPIDGIPLIKARYFGGREDGLLDRMIAQAKSCHMEVVAKISLMCDIRLLTERPDLASIARNSAPLAHPFVSPDWYSFLCPNREELVLGYQELVESLLSEHEIDAVNFDYVGHAFAMQENRRVFACYCARCRDIFRTETGQDPLEISQLDTRWVDWRASRIASNLRQLSRTVKKHSVLVEVTQDQDETTENRIYNMYKRALGLDLNELRQFVDRFLPRSGHPNLHLFLRQLNYFGRAFGLRTVPEIPRNVVSKAEDLLGYLRAAEVAGAEGVALHGFGSLPGSYALDTLRIISDLVRPQST